MTHLTRRAATLGLVATAAATTAAPARADWNRWFNGARVGAGISLDGLQYLNEPPLAAPRATLVYFWATWCGPCLPVLPELARLRERHAADGLAVLAITREEAEPVQRFIQRQPIGVTVALDPQRRLHKDLSIRAIPIGLLADERLRILWVGQPEALAADVIKAALAPPRNRGGAAG